MAASSNMIILIAGGKHVRSVMSRSPLMRPGTRRLHAGAGAPDTLQRSLYSLLTVDGTTGRRAPSRSRCAVHQAWCTSQGSWRSRTGARRSRSGCSRSGCDTPKGHRKRIAYFDLLENFACPFHHAGVVSVAGGGRATLIMACQNQFAADALRSFCGSTPVLAPSDHAHWQVENVLR